MRRISLMILILTATVICFAQADKSKDLFAFRITDYTVKLNDSTALVEIDLSKGNVGIAEGQVAVLNANSNFSTPDTAAIGWGKCHLIKGSYYYFAIHIAKGKRLPQKGDVLHTYAIYPAAYKGQVFKLIQHDIYMQHVEETPFYSFAFSVFGDAAQETSVLDSMVADIKYTAREMLKINPGQDLLITEGKFKNKKVFAAMQEATRNDVKDFLDYVIARPIRYECNDWKISETFATWMNAGAPMAIKD